MRQSLLHLRECQRTEHRDNEQALTLPQHSVPGQEAWANLLPNLRAFRQVAVERCQAAFAPAGQFYAFACPFRHKGPGIALIVHR